MNDSANQLTIEHYERNAKSFWEGTKDHDVTQNYEALLSALPQKSGLKILDFGCGPGRDLFYFKSQGHAPVGLDGCQNFCKMSEAYSGCPTLHQNFLSLDLKPETFDGVFANASLFHVPKAEIVRVLKDLATALVPNGILFSSNPRGKGESFDGSRFANFMEWEEYSAYLLEAGFVPSFHYYRPPGIPREAQPWLAVVSQKK